MFHTAKENNIEIEAEWVPRPLNEKADYLGKTSITGRLKITILMMSLLEAPVH